VQVVLLERVEKLGQMGDVVNVRGGYARNYLVPQGKALRATKGNLAEFEKRRVQLEAANLKRKEEAQAAVGRVEGRMVTVLRQAGEGGQLYGSVNARDIAQALTVHRNQVRLEMALKTLGLHQVRIALHPEVQTWVTVNIARSAEEADIQANPELAAALEAREAEEQAALAAEAEEPGPLEEPS
jgi:large subunit ribosomal protein L9